MKLARHAWLLGFPALAIACQLVDPESDLPDDLASSPDASADAAAGPDAFAAGDGKVAMGDAATRDDASSGDDDGGDDGGGNPTGDASLCVLNAGAALCDDFNRSRAGPRMAAPAGSTAPATLPAPPPMATRCATPRDTRSTPSCRGTTPTQAAGCSRWSSRRRPRGTSISISRPTSSRRPPRPSTSASAGSTSPTMQERTAAFSRSRFASASATTTRRPSSRWSSPSAWPHPLRCRSRRRWTRRPFLLADALVSHSHRPVPRRPADQPRHLELYRSAGGEPGGRGRQSPPRAAPAARLSSTSASMTRASRSSTARISFYDNVVLTSN